MVYFARCHGAAMKNSSCNEFGGHTSSVDSLRAQAVIDDGTS